VAKASAVSGSVAALATALERNEVSSADLVMACLDRVAKHNHQGAGINAVLEVNPDALALADGLDWERTHQGVRGPLHGIPVLLKDNIDTGDRLHTSAGSLALAESRARQDAPVAQRLRAAGAIILGKSNMTEWANFMSDHMPNGYSSRGGQVRNPYGPGKLDTGGSSSGSGAGVAAGFAFAAVGTETSGSILSPSSQHALAGLKPTLGLISRSGIIPIAHSQDTAGPMCLTVEDVAIMLEVMAGEDPADPATMLARGRIPASYRSALDPEGLQGARFGVPRAYWDKLSSDQNRVLEQALANLRDLGATVVDDVKLPGRDELPGWTVLEYEFKADLNAYLSRLGPAAAVHSLQEVIRFNLAHADQCLAYGQSQLLSSDATSGTLTEAAYLEARLADIRLARGGIDEAMGQHRLDALLFCGSWGASIAAKAGYPSLTVPAGFTDEGEPVGLTMTARAFEEPMLLRLGHAYQIHTAHWRPPVLETAGGPA
jgi:amidase